MKNIAKKSFSIGLFLYALSATAAEIPTPNDFVGSDIERIQLAIDAAKGKANKVVIPMWNSNGTTSWKVDRAILLPRDITVILNNCTIQLSDQCRDNMFRSDNVGIGISEPEWSYNIHIIGVGDVLLQGTDKEKH